MSDTPKPTKSTTFTDEERAAMKERVKELKAAARRGAHKAETAGEVLAKIAEMPEPDRAMAERLHARHHGQRAGPLAETLVRACPPTPRTARSSASSRPRRSSRRGTRRSASATRRTSTKAPCGRPSFALKELTAADEARIGALVKKAVS